MNTITTFTQRALDNWLYSLCAAFIGGGASAITSGAVAIGIAPDKFNINSWSGFWHVLGMIAANFIISGILSVAFYLRQSPLPPKDADSQQSNEAK